MYSDGFCGGRRLRCAPLALLLLLFAPLVRAETITIDSFNYPAPASAFFLWESHVGNPFHLEQDVPEVLGDQRDLFVQVVGAPRPTSPAVLVGYEAACDAGILELATGGGFPRPNQPSVPATYLIAKYDGTGSKPMTDEDLTRGGTNNAFKLAFFLVDPGSDRSTLALEIRVTGSNGSAQFTGQVPEGFGVDFYAEFSKFEVTGDSPFSSATSIEFEFNNGGMPAPNVDFDLDRIQAVPEPSTWMLLFGLAALAAVCQVWRRGRR